MTNPFSTATELERLAWSLRVPLGGVYWRDRLPRRIYGGTGIILNLQGAAEEGAGTHWVALACPMGEPVAYYFDSFGMPPPREVIAAAAGRRLAASDQIIQNPRSGYCGLYCVLFLATAFGRLRACWAPTMGERVGRYRALFSSDVAQNKERLLEIWERVRSAA